MDIARHVRWLKPPVFLLCLGPLLNLGLRFYDVAVRGGSSLGANPTEFIRNSLGFWTLTFLCITLVITPARRLLHQNWLIRFRRMVGLFAFFYGCLHLITYVWFDTGFNWSMIVQDVYMRPFITLGFASFLLMVPLAITSTSGMVRRLGGKNWALLHRLVYFSAILGAIHYYWLVKIDETVPTRFAVTVGVLLAYRIVYYFVERKGSGPSKGAAPRPAKPTVVSA
jgi:methionine sulfoxide reductase heme-binding subunit